MKNNKLGETSGDQVLCSEIKQILNGDLIEENSDQSGKGQEDTNFEKAFFQIASELMNNYTLVIQSKKYQLSELEFYYFSKDHQDPYVHGDCKQLGCGGFYVHQKNGNRGGVDITFGDKASATYGGILIRAIKSLSSQQYITGPAKVRQEFDKELNESAFEKVQEIIDEGHRVQLIKSQSSIPQVEVYKSTRVGLKPNVDDYNTGQFFLYKKYRFLAKDLVNSLTSKEYSNLEKKTVLSWREEQPNSCDVKSKKVKNSHDE